MDWLLDATAFITRNHCGPGWTPTLIAVNRVANFLIFLSYFTIPLSLLYFWLELRRHEVAVGVLGPNRVRKLIILNFVVFIFLCSFTHLCDVFAFEWAPYRLFTCVDLLTAIASVSTALILPGMLRTIVDVLRGEERKEG